MSLNEPRPLAQAISAAGWTALLIPELHAKLGGQAFDGLGEREMFDLLHEGDDVAALTAAEAVPGPHGRTDVEGRALLVMKWAQPLQRAGPGGAQGDVLAYDVLDRRPILDLRHVIGLDQTRH